MRSFMYLSVVGIYILGQKEGVFIALYLSVTCHVGIWKTKQSNETKRQTNIWKEIIENLVNLPWLKF